MNRNVLVTGGTRGIGEAISREFAKKGYNLIINYVNSNEKAQNLKQELEKEYNITVEVRILDLVNRKNCKELYDEVKKQYGFVDIIVNNAGFGTCGEFVKTDLDKELKMIDTNIVALHILTKLFLKDMVKEDKGYIMNVASIAGFMPGPLMATYYATKAYVVRLTQSIQQELKMKKSNVKVSILCPGPVKTNFQKIADVKFNIPETKSEDVAKIAVKKMLKNRQIIFTQFHINMTRMIAKILPDKFMAFCCYFIQKRKIQ